MEDQRGSVEPADSIEEEIGLLTEDLAATKESAPPPPAAPRGPSLWRSWPVAAVLSAIAAAMTIAHLMGLGPYRHGPPPRTPQQQQQQGELELLALVGYIEDYQEEHGRPPRTLDQLDLDVGDLVFDYEPFGEEDFVVSLTKGGALHSYDSRQPAAEPPLPTD